MGAELELFRADQYIGRARVESVKRNSALATVKPEYSRGLVQKADRVTTRLRK
jgi:hypothetical protein